MNQNRLIIIDCGHGKETKGKCSPKFEDGTRFYEWEFSRRLASKIADGLAAEGIRYVVITMGATDVSLSGRAARANSFGLKSLFISLHGNASGSDDTWRKAQGWSIWTSKGVTKSDPIAEVFIQKAEEILPQVGMKVRKYSNKKNEGDWEDNFTVLKKTIMPAVLTENGFQDNLHDVEIMKSEEGLEALARVHVEAIKEILEKGL